MTHMNLKIITKLTLFLIAFHILPVYCDNFSNLIFVNYATNPAIKITGYYIQKKNTKDSNGILQNCGDMRTPSNWPGVSGGQSYVDSASNPCAVYQFPLKLTIQGYPQPNLAIGGYNNYASTALVVDVRDDFFNVRSQEGGDKFTWNFDVYGNQYPTWQEAQKGSVAAPQIYNLVNRATDLADAAWQFQQVPLLKGNASYQTIFCNAVAPHAKTLYQRTSDIRKQQWVDTQKTPDGTLTFAQLCNVPYR